MFRTLFLYPCVILILATLFGTFWGVENIFALEASPAFRSAPTQYQGKTAEQWVADLTADQANPVVRNRVRWYAGYALGQLGPQATSAVDALIERLNETGEYEYVRSVCAWSLGQIQDARAIPALTANLESKLTSVRKECASALGHFGPKAQSAVPALEVLLSEQLPSESGIANPVANAADNVAKTPNASDASGQTREPAERASAAAALWKIASDDPSGQKGKQVLLQAIISNSVRNRLAAVSELKNMPTDLGLADFYKPLAFLAQKSNNEDVARESARLLAACNQTESAEKMLTDDSAQVRWRGLRLFFFAEQTPPVDKVLPLTKDTDSITRAWAIRVLSKAMDNQDAETAIVKAVDDESPEVKSEARKALKKQERN